MPAPPFGTAGSRTSRGGILQELSSLMPSWTLEGMTTPICRDNCGHLLCLTGFVGKRYRSHLQQRTSKARDLRAARIGTFRRTISEHWLPLLALFRRASDATSSSDELGFLHDTSGCQVAQETDSRRRINTEVCKPAVRNLRPRRVYLCPQESIAGTRLPVLNQTPASYPTTKHPTIVRLRPPNGDSSCVKTPVK